MSATRHARQRGSGGISADSFNLPDAIAARVRELRVARGWSQDQMANEAGLSKDAVSRIERGDRSPRLDTLQRIGAAVGVSLPKLVDFGETLTLTRSYNHRRRSLQRLLDQLDPPLVAVVITLVRGLVRAQSHRH